MTTYKYNGISPSGEKVSGIIEAYSEYEAASQLREKCPVITGITEVKKQQAGISFGGNKIKEKNLAILCSQFSIILTSGLPIVRCVEMVADQTTDKPLKAMLKEVAADVAGGYTLAQSFEDHGTGLPVTFIETIRAGEESGTLETSFARLEKYFDKSSKTKDKVKGALTYPIIVICVAVVVAAIVMIKAVPMFKSTFASMGTDLPGVTKALINVSDFFVKDWAILLIIIFAVIIFLKLFKQTEKGKIWDGERKLKRSLFKRINSMNSASQFANTMSTMLSSGLPVVRAMDITANVMSNYILSRALKVAVAGVEQGRGIAECLRESGVFPELLVEMTGVGEESGNMEGTLDVIGEYYDSEVNVATTRLLTIMEPAITIGLAVMTVFLLLSVYLPMFGMYSGM